MCCKFCVKIPQLTIYYLQWVSNGQCLNSDFAAWITYSCSRGVYTVKANDIHPSPYAMCFNHRKGTLPPLYILHITPTVIWFHLNVITQQPVFFGLNVISPLPILSKRMPIWFRVMFSFLYFTE